MRRVIAEHGVDHARARNPDIVRRAAEGHAVIGHARAGPEPMNSGNSEIVRGVRRALDVPHVERQDDEVIVLGPAPLGTKFIIVVLEAVKARRSTAPIR